MDPVIYSDNINSKRYVPQGSNDLHSLMLLSQLSRKSDSPPNELVQWKSYALAQSLNILPTQSSMVSVVSIPIICQKVQIPNVACIQKYISLQIYGISLSDSSKHKYVNCQEAWNIKNEEILVTWCFRSWPYFHLSSDCHYSDCFINVGLRHI